MKKHIKIYIHHTQYISHRIASFQTGPLAPRVEELLAKHECVMSRDEFWAIIAQLEKERWPDCAIIPFLDKFTPAEFISYQHHFDTLINQAYHWNLWGAVQILGPATDDDFIDFRYGLLGKGKAAYESALKEPDSLADLSVDKDTWNEPFGYIASVMYKRSTGTDIPRIGIRGLGAPPLGEKFNLRNSKELARRYPSLWKKCGHRYQEGARTCSATKRHTDTLNIVG